MTKWLSPRVLVSSAVEVAVSGLFGSYADKREIEGGLSDACFDCRFGESGTYWLDYASDVGDGFDSTYTIAHFLAQETLELAGETTQRGRVLVLGGDEVYPSATRERYEEHFRAPYSAALPEIEDEDARPRMFAIPGNHDWYDGLTSFMRTFSQGKAIGGWQTEQKRSYFALQLPHGWWLWGIDIQFDTFIDAPQLDYFRNVAAKMPKEAKIILATAKPSWVAVTDPQDPPQSWQTLAFLQEQVMGAKLALTLTGDIHHYAYYEPAGDEDPKFTAGGGGAYLSATHWLPPSLELPSLDRETTTAYTLERCWPEADTSRNLLKGIWKHALPWVTPSLHVVTAAIYAVIAMLIAVGIQDHDANLDDSLDADGFKLAVDALSFWGVLLIAGVVLALRTWAKRGEAPGSLGVIHAVLQIAAATVLTLLLLEWDPLNWADDGSRLGYAVAAVVALASCLVARWILVAYLLIVPRMNARWHVEEAFAGQAIADYKHFLRLKLEPEKLTVYAIGVEKVPTEWGEGKEPKPAGGKWPTPTIIDRRTIPKS
jgi:hypothetical protein